MGHIFMDKMFSTGFFLGRMQPLHIFHEKLIETGLQICEKMIIMIGSSQESGTLRNPLSIELRMELAQKVFGDRVIILPLADMSHEADASFAWGDYLMEHILNTAGTYPDLMIYGNEESRQGWFRPGVFEQMGHLMFPRPSDGVSSTHMRKIISEGDYNAWKRYSNPLIYPYFNEIQHAIIQSK